MAAARLRLSASTGENVEEEWGIFVFFAYICYYLCKNIILYYCMCVV